LIGGGLFGFSSLVGDFLNVEAASCRWPEAGMPRPHFQTLEIDLTIGVPYSVPLLDC
jgi:hypothetical protein